MAEITQQDGIFLVKSVVKDFEEKAEAALDQIANDQAILADSPTNAEMIAILDGALERQAGKIKVLRKMLREQSCYKQGR